MAHITKRKNGSYLIRVSNGLKNGKQVFVNKTYKPLPGSSERTARRGAEQYTACLNIGISGSRKKRNNRRRKKTKYHKQRPGRDFLYPVLPYKTEHMLHIF